jgi:hypothetical protein
MNRWSFRDCFFKVSCVLSLEVYLRFFVSVRCPFGYAFLCPPVVAIIGYSLPLIIMTTCFCQCTKLGTRHSYYPVVINIWEYTVGIWLASFSEGYKLLRMPKSVIPGLPIFPRVLTISESRYPVSLFLCPPVADNIRE